MISRLRCIGIGAIVGTTSNDMLVSTKSDIQHGVLMFAVVDSCLDQSSHGFVWCLVTGRGVSRSDSARNVEPTITADYR